MKGNSKWFEPFSKITSHQLKLVKIGKTVGSPAGWHWPEHRGASAHTRKICKEGVVKSELVKLLMGNWRSSLSSVLCRAMWDGSKTQASNWDDCTICNKTVARVVTLWLGRNIETQLCSTDSWTGWPSTDTNVRPSLIRIWWLSAAQNIAGQEGDKFINLGLPQNQLDRPRWQSEYKSPPCSLDNGWVQWCSTIQVLAVGICTCQYHLSSNLLPKARQKDPRKRDSSF